VSEEVTSGVIVYVRHVRQANLCMKGMREWFAHHDLPLNTFRTEGLPVEVIEATGDKMALDVAAVARSDRNGNG